MSVMPAKEMPHGRGDDREQQTQSKAGNVDDHKKVL
jgi:hypothetical protein